MNNNFDFIVPVHNHENTLQDLTHKCLSSIRTQAPGSNIILINNYKDDKSVYDCDDLITANENLGVAKSWNVGIKVARRKYVCIINNDVEIAPNFIEGILSVFEHNGSDNGFAYPTEINFIPFEEYAKEIVPGQFFDKQSTGLCFVTTREMFNEIGDFDEQFSPCYYEDTDMWKRAEVNNKFMCATTNAMVYINGRSCTSKKLFDIDRIMARNRDRFCKKWNMSL